MEFKYIKTLPRGLLYKIYNYLTLNNLRCIKCQEIIPNEDVCINSSNQIYCLDCFNKKSLLKKYTKNVNSCNSYRYKIISSLRKFFKK